MELTNWVIGIGALLLAMSIGGGLIARLPLSPAVIYFGLGLLLGPWGMGWLLVDPSRHGPVIERICEVAVLVSLFATGSNLGGTLRGRHWKVPLRLASVGMLLTIVAMSLIGYVVLHLSLGVSVLLAAILAPTDPVLASEVQVADPADRDRLRFGLTGEAGLNDGAAFPFVMLGLGLLSLHDLGPGGWRWWVLDVAWAIAGGLVVGASFGVLLGQWLVRSYRDDAGEAGNDAFLGLGLMAVAYGVAVALHAYGFLAVFAAAVALQWIVSGAGRTHRRALPTPAGSNGLALASAAANASATEDIVAPIQRFNQHLESLFEFGVMILIGAFFAGARVPAAALAVIPILFFVVRPVSVLLALHGTRLDRHQRVLASWFGIRGVGSMYYVFYAITHGIPAPIAEHLLGIVTAVVVASVLLHGVSVTPLMTLYELRRAQLARHDRPRSPPG